MRRFPFFDTIFKVILSANPSETVSIADHLIYSVVSEFPSTILANTVTGALIEKTASSLIQEEKAPRTASTILPITTSYFEEAATIASIPGTDGSPARNVLDIAGSQLISSPAFADTSLEERIIVTHASLELFLRAQDHFTTDTSSLAAVRETLAKCFDKLADVGAFSPIVASLWEEATPSYICIYCCS